MPRKSKKNLFRRGDTQQYKRIRIIKKQRKITEPIHAKQSSLPIFQLILFMGFFALAMLFLPSISTNIKLFFQTISIQLILLLDFAKNLFRAITFELPTISIPEADLSSIIDYAKRILMFLNPKPYFKSTISTINYLNILSIGHSLWIIKTTSTFLSYLDPRPGIIILTEFTVRIVILTFNAIYFLLSLMNPFPGMKKTSEIEILIVKQMLNSLVFLLYFIIDIFRFTVELLLNGLFSIFNFIVEIFNDTTSAMSYRFSRIVDGIKFRTVLVAEFMSPYVHPITDNIKTTAHGLIESSKHLREYIDGILNQYNEYRPH